jgi:hypothetical protein
MSIHAAFAAVVERLEMLENHTGINNAVVEGDDMVAARNGKIKKAHR